MGGAVGIGNLLRYPSIAARHSGLQWFIPYLLALLLIGIPVLLLEISLGQTHRAAAVGANNAVHRRLRGLGVCSALIALITVTYYVNIMALILSYIRHSFTRPLPWGENPEKFFSDVVVQNIKPTGDVRTGFLKYTGGMVWETFGWTILTWILIYLCLFKGVALTGRVVYFTMLVPLLLCVVILIRAVTLERARNGVVQYVGSWSSAKLRGGDIWKDAVIQIFFSIGTGFAYFIVYASYNSRHSHAVQDALIIAFSNSLIEVVVGFAAFSVVGFLRLDLNKVELSTFVLGFFTYPTALARIPGSNAWAFFFFLTVYLLAIDSAFALLEAFIGIITDTWWSKRVWKELLVGIITIIAMLFSFMYSSKFGLTLLDVMDKWLTGITLTFAVFVECVAVTTLYRYKDAVAQVGPACFWGAQAAYIGSMVLGIIVAHTAQFGLGVLAFVASLLICTSTAVMMTNQPTVTGSFGSNRYLNALWWVTMYPGQQLTRDLNIVVGTGGNWKLPIVWAPLLRWVAAPVLISVFSLSYREFGSEAKIYRNPLHIFAFTVAQVGIVITVIGLGFSNLFNFLVPGDQRDADQKQYATSPGVTLLDGAEVTSAEVEDIEENL